MTKRSSDWSQEEEDFLRKYYGIFGPKIMAEKLNRSRHAIHNKARILGLTYRHSGLKIEGDRVKMNLVDRFAGKYEAPVWQTRAGSEDHSQYKTRGTLC